jgi:3-demethoxyubiquinol 3-hydroxylase
MKSNKIHSMIRVNQAGEYGAKRIYEGQIASLHEGPKKEKIKEMYYQELKHLEYFDNELIKRRVRPTIMQPIWNIGAYALGFISGKISPEAAMACTAAVEEVIDEHYESQIDALEMNDKEQELRTNIMRFRNEEIDHKNIGLEQSADMPRELYKSIIKGLTKLAITISKKI